MENVYEIITRLREERKLSTRTLATIAHIPPTTLESAILRHPDTVSVRMLTKIGHAFGVEWHELLSTTADPGLITLGAKVPRVPSAVDPEEAEKIVEHILSIPMPPPVEDTVVVSDGQKATPSYRYGRTVSVEEHFCQSILVVLRKLNSDGLMEAMRRILDVASNPAYCNGKEEQP